MHRRSSMEFRTDSAKEKTRTDSCCHRSMVFALWRNAWFPFDRGETRERRARESSDGEEREERGEEEEGGKRERREERREERRKERGRERERERSER